MSLRSKVLLILGLVFCFLGSVIYMTQTYIVLPKFIELDREEAIHRIQSVLAAINREIEALCTTNEDWAAWNPMYDYAETRNEEFIRQNVSVSNLESADVDLLVIAGLDGQPIFTLTREMPSERSDALRNIAGSVVARARGSAQTDGPRGIVRGLAMTAHGPVFVAAHAITTNDSKSPPRGILLMAKSFTSEIEKRLMTQTQTQFHYHELNKPAPDPQLQQTIARITPKNPIYVEE
ncbi:hypothetical protein HYR69_03795, partial [Candidatus Sumerlaeota bacterium]|nr:hypothetical protein [Candidatus Sumerlaeota bacterium]